MCPVPLTSSAVPFIITKVFWLQGSSFTVGFPNDHPNSQLGASPSPVLSSNHLTVEARPASVFQYLNQSLRKPGPLAYGKVKRLVIP